MALKRIERLAKTSRILKDESGSIAVIIIGLFVVTVAALMVMTDVSTIIIAKRSLAQAFSHHNQSCASGHSN